MYDEIIKMWQQWEVVTESDMDLRLHNYRILFAYHSSKIENPEIEYHDTREIFENGRVIGFTGDPRSLFELNNQKMCYAFLRKMYAERAPLGMDLLLETHAILTNGTYDERRFLDLGERPGSFKQHDFVVGQYEVGVLPEDVPQEIETLLQEMDGFSGSAYLRAAACFHARFEYIHPFADGNGRVGRTLMNYFLMLHNHPPLIIYDEDKKDYYEALDAYDQEEEIEPLLLFLVQQAVKTWKQTYGNEAKR